MYYIDLVNIHHPNIIHFKLLCAILSSLPFTICLGRTPKISISPSNLWMGIYATLRRVGRSACSWTTSSSDPPSNRSSQVITGLAYIRTVRLLPSQIRAREIHAMRRLFEDISTSSIPPLNTLKRDVIYVIRHVGFGQTHETTSIPP